MIAAAVNQIANAGTVTEVVWFGVSGAALAAGIVQVFKQAGFPVRFAGLLALVLGTSAGLLAGWQSPVIGWYDGLGQGLLAGLSAAGAWSASRAIANGKEG
jgi:hypothetical protein